MDSLGIHIMAEYSGCDQSLINDVVYIEEVMLKSAKESGAAVISSSFHHFSPYGVSGVVVIQESHIAIHTWPEYQFASVDIFTCGDTVDPWKAYEFLKTALNAGNGTAIKMSRGSNIHNVNVPMEDGIMVNQFRRSGDQIFPLKQNSWLTLKGENTAFSVKYSGSKIYHGEESGTVIDIVETHEYGKLLMLNGKPLFSESDEHIYHEMLVHPAMNMVNEKVRVLITGPASGAIRELNRYHFISGIDIAVSNKLLNEAISRGFPSLPYTERGEVGNTEPCIRDFDSILNNGSVGTYDLIFLDYSGVLDDKFTDPSFIEKTLKLSTDNGIIVIPLGPVPRAASIISANPVLNYIFNIPLSIAYLSFLPTSPEGEFLYLVYNKNTKSMTFNSKVLPDSAPDVISGLKYYAPEIGKMIFLLSNYTKMRIKRNISVIKGEKIGSKVEFI